MKPFIIVKNYRKFQSNKTLNKYSHTKTKSIKKLKV